MSTSSTLVRVTFSVAAIIVSGCSGAPQHPGHSEGALMRIACMSKADCVARGGDCVNGQCVAANECAKDADCPQGQICVPDDNFGGLCAVSKDDVQAGPAWACQLGKDCPLGQGCGSDNLCHVDGDCSNNLPCANGQLCYNAGNDSDRGFCADARPSHDPYCRSDGQGACRNECDQNNSCGDGATCKNGFCHANDECAAAGDCAVNQICAPVSDSEDYGYSECANNPNPMCVDDGHGACRLQCNADTDCIDGGGCGADKLCHASNECAQDTDCPQGQKCYADPEWGGLCGAAGR
jgi:hypothetical protein